MDAHCAGRLNRSRAFPPRCFILLGLCWVFGACSDPESATDCPTIRLAEPIALEGTEIALVLAWGDSSGGSGTIERQNFSAPSAEFCYQLGDVSPHDSPLVNSHSLGIYADVPGEILSRVYVICDVEHDPAVSCDEVADLFEGPLPDVVLHPAE